MSIRSDLLILADQLLAHVNQDYEASRRRYTEDCLAVFDDTLDSFETSTFDAPDYTKDMPDPRNYIPDTHGLMLTIGVTLDENRELVSWHYQTGDNSYTGGAYGHAHWLVTYLAHTDNAHEIVNDLIDQLNDIKGGN